MALIVIDRATGFLAAYPSERKSGEATEAAFRHYQGPNQTVRYLWSDNSEEIKHAAQEMKWTEE